MTVTVTCSDNDSDSDNKNHNDNNNFIYVLRLFGWGKPSSDPHIPQRINDRRVSKAESWVGLIVCFLPLQVRPSPVYPALHLQEYEPMVFIQSALTSQLEMLVLHSSRSKTINKESLYKKHNTKTETRTKQKLRWLVTVSSTSQDLEFDGSL